MEYKFPNKGLLERHSGDLKENEYSLSEIVYQNDFKNKLVFPVGMDDEKEKYYIDFEAKSSILIAGETGSGKSMYLNSIILSYLLKNSPDELQLILIDPRGVEFNSYYGIPHLYGRVYSDKPGVLSVFSYVMDTLEKRRDLFLKSNKRDITAYNLEAKEKLSHIVIVIDEILDIIDSAEIESSIDRILMEGYKFGIHIIIATNSYFKNHFKQEKINLFNYVLTFDLASEEQAKYIKISKANLLHGNWEALIKCVGNKLLKVQTPYVSIQDIEEVINYIIREN